MCKYLWTLYFDTDEYKNIYDQISQHEDIKVVTIDSLMKVMEHYENINKPWGRKSA